MQTEEQKQDWLKQRLKIVGASEISTVIKSECTEEEIREAMGGSADEFMKDKLFTSPFCLYNYKKELATPPPFSPILSEYGHEMEKHGVDYIKYKYFEKLGATNQPQELIYCKDLHKLCAYTPDAFIVFDRARTMHKDVMALSKAIFEIKTSNLFMFHKENWGVPEGQEEVKFQYIIQAQYQLWIQNKIDPSFKWAVIACILPKEPQIDIDFEKGKAVEWCKGLDFANLEIKEIFAKKLETNYAVHLWIYPIFKSLHPLFKMALDRWDKRLQNCSEPKPTYDNDKDIKILKKKLAENMEEFKVECQKKFGKENQGIIKFTETLKEKYQDLHDKLQLDKQNREDKLHADKSIKSFEAEMISILLNERVLGFDIDSATIHIKKWGKGFRLMNNFKTSSETLEGKVKIKDEIKPEIGVESFI